MKVIFCDICGQEIEDKSSAIYRVEIFSHINGETEVFEDVCQSCVSKIKKIVQTSEESAAQKVDHGKIQALHQAGWSQKKIAEEMKITPSAVCQILKKMKAGGENAKREKV